ncbi:hypothetical protein [Kitasatospora sp. SC0581]|uniref:hypothetical protein n=1 Tax=Kitasatospora sp. SC0581 TaxID=3394360 RepID=UPI003A83D868
MSTLASALATAVDTAVDTERLARTPAHLQARRERRLWTEEQAARFLRFTHLVAPLHADLT